MLNKELLQQVIDALEDAVGLHVRWDDAHAETITALRSALAAPMPEQWNPIATPLEYLTRCADGTTFRNVVQMPAHAIEWAAPPAAPADMVMVPREPTPDMARAGWALLPSGLKDPWDYGIVKARQVYRAMIAATPPAAPAPVVPADQWKAAIDNELICCHIGTTDSFPNAKSALKNLIDWHVSVAIDPAVSSDAQALIDRGAAQPADLTETAHRIENGEITNGHFSHRNLVMCSKEHYAALIDSTLTAQPAVPLTDDHTNNVLAALLIARRYVLTNPEQLASIAYAINIVKTHGITGGGK